VVTNQEFIVFQIQDGDLKFQPIRSRIENSGWLTLKKQWSLLFSKSKIAATNFSQLGAELTIQDG